MGRDGAVSEQIEASIAEELARLKARAQPQGESLTHCAECEEPIPEAAQGCAGREAVHRLASDRAARPDMRGINGAGRRTAR